MKVFVTGGNGFIGHSLVRSLLMNGYEVMVVDTKPIAFTHKNLTFIKKSIEDDLRFNMRDCDVVFHLAALLGVISSDSNPLRTLRVNIDGTINVFKCALDAGIKKVVYSSSSEVYGEAQEIPLNENSPKAPVSVYGVSKLTSEMYAHGYTKEHGIDINPVRLFNVYGPGQGFDWVIPLFIKKVLNDQAPIVFGDGKQIRCFTFIDDIVKGMQVVMEKGKFGEVYNIANDQQITMKELAELIIKKSGKNLKEKIVGYSKETRTEEREIKTRVPGIKKLMSVGWKPEVGVEEGVAKTFEWYKQNLGKEELFYE